MRLTDHMSRSGQQLFRWRSYVPFIALPFMVWAMLSGKRIEADFGVAASLVWDVACIGLIALGEAIRCLTVGFVPTGTSGRNVKDQLATRLNTSGAYSLVRNPLYLGNCLMYVGLGLLTQSWVLGLVMGLALWPYYERIIAAEEAFLSEKFGAEYEAFCAATPAFLPSLRGWQRPDLGFSVAMMLRRELVSLYGAVIGVYIVQLILHQFGPTARPLAPAWHWLALAATLLELVGIYLKRRTNVLKNRIL